jgi:hypothetical protein
MTDVQDTEGTAYPWPDEQVEMTPSAELANGTEAAPWDGESAPVVADSTASMNDSGREPAVPFLQSLVDAMRRIAEQTRDDAMAQLRAVVAERSARIHSETEERATELHELADADLRGIAAWEQGEVQRIRDEAAAKVSARNATLEAQIAANVAAGEGAVTAVQARVDAFEAEMTSFFAQLNDIHDPAALGSALKRIPQAPSLADAAVAPAGDTAPSPAVVTAVEPTPSPTPAVEPEPAPQVTSATAVSAAPEPAEPTNGVAEAAESADALPATATATATAVAEPVAAEPVVAEPAVAEPAVAEPPAEPAAEAPAEETVEEATTQVLVTGLTSFGAITSFKQSLESVKGVHRVSLGLGTSGEFIFTAIHNAGFDLSAAIRTFEETAQFVAANGQLRVTVGSKA